MGALAEKGFRRATICISSQVGCAVNCQFCLTAKLGIQAQPDGGRDCGAGGGGAEPARDQDGERPHQPGVYGDGRAVPEL